MVMLIPDWKRVVKHAWSFRLILLAGALSGVEFIMPLIEDWINKHDLIPRGLFGLFAFVVTMSAAVARLCAQPKMHRSERDET